MSLADALAAIRDVDTAEPGAVKACCATVYGLDLVSLFLGPSYHPGGAALTRRLADHLELRPGQRVLDVASGIGTTAMLLAAEHDVEVLGIDLGAAQVTRARDRAAAAGLSYGVRFEIGDAERLHVDDGAFDAVVCECAFCTFPDKPTAVAELAGAVRPDGRIGISDVWLAPDRLNPELTGLAGRIACLADARPINELTAILTAAGLTITHLERHDHALADTIEQVITRLRALRLADVPMLRPVNLARGIELAEHAADAVHRGDGGYLLLTATKT
jgi:arsenite methyltransferase